jgi:Na+-transporting methylmalonyl-CoA/oxaloacetate decarboxylase gamma subunit
MFFPKGTPEQFKKQTITWKNIVPDFLVFIIPLLVGLALLIHDFSWILLVLIIILFFLGFMGNAVVRSQLACRYCRQREIGCPAQRLFERTKT